MIGKELYFYDDNGKSQDIPIYLSLQSVVNYPAAILMMAWDKQNLHVSCGLDKSYKLPVGPINLPCLAADRYCNHVQDTPTLYTQCNIIGSGPGVRYPVSFTQCAGLPPLPAGG